jgi:dephospho-CoA kinase
VSSDGPFVVGLTGGIGSGKSAAGKRFAELGAGVVDTDVIAHALTGPDGAAMPDILKVFGPGIAAADGALDRAAMRIRVFADAAERRRLEEILHPMIRAESDRCVAQLSATGVPYVILVVPLLVESMRGKGTNYRERVQRLAVVDCAPETQIQRVIERNGLSLSDVQRILAVQATRDQRLSVADDVIDNDGSFSELAAQIDVLDRDYRRYRHA